MLLRLLKFVNKKLRPKHMRNIVDATYLIRYVRKFAGASVLTIESNSVGIITTTFSLFGCISFLFWYSLYFYCLYKIHAEDQTILRSLYNTKLQHYGDEVERFTNNMFILYAIWKVPFDLSGSTIDMQKIVDIDRALQEFGEVAYCSRHWRLASIVCLAQIFISVTRMFSVWMSLLTLGSKMPIEKVFQMVFTDSIVFIITTQYCSYLLILRRRYRFVNKILNSVKRNNDTELSVIGFKNAKFADKPFLVKEKNVSKKVAGCAKIYSMLYKATETANEKFGFVILLTMMMTLLQIILYLYYFMEATASGLFHDFQNYIDFLIYVFWQIGYALSIIYVCIYFSDATVKEARITPHVVHEIINSDVDPAVTSEAVHLSLQILHQIPTFTAHGLFKLDYMMMLEGARSVTTFLVILLQFVTDKHSN
ncbi:putative gustatory receptor 28b [Vanessa cardui]|uniref:putative gustatory receptor 28b n=1 Tax=Vanessa cardui TaxID=171605 RepID=UPI001F12C79C|nr:putative gustatory receptor 28b [Vanessa cardui]